MADSTCTLIMPSSIGKYFIEASILNREMETDKRYLERKLVDGLTKFEEKFIGRTKWLKIKYTDNYYSPEEFKKGLQELNMVKNDTQFNTLISELSKYAIPLTLWSSMKIDKLSDGTNEQYRISYSPACPK